MRKTHRRRSEIAHGERDSQTDNGVNTCSKRGTEGIAMSARVALSRRSKKRSRGPLNFADAEKRQASIGARRKRTSCSQDERNESYDMATAVQGT